MGELSFKDHLIDALCEISLQILSEGTHAPALPACTQEIQNKAVVDAGLGRGCGEVHLGTWRPVPATPRRPDSCQPEGLASGYEDLGQLSQDEPAWG